MFNFKHLLRSVPIVLLSSLLVIFTLENHVWSATCDEVFLSERAIATTQMLEPQQLKADIITTMFEGKEGKILPITKAKGQVAERETKRFFEKGSVVSLVTFFEMRGCNMKGVFHNGADHGIDDIFVHLTPDRQHIDRHYKPLFVEAKYSEACRMQLAKTKTICTQLSKVWLGFHLDAMDERAQNLFKALNVFIGDSQWNINKTNGESFSCSKAFFTEISWLQEQINSGFYLRAASLLCPDGYLSIYGVSSVPPTIH